MERYRIHPDGALFYVAFTIVAWLHANPCRKGLVTQPENWRFSSAGHWLGGNDLSNDVILTPVFW
jgi:hypothetical protein